MLADIFFSYRLGGFFLSIFICHNLICASKAEPI